MPSTPTAAGALAPSVAQIGFGQVRHTRLAPRVHAFAYPTCFLLLPLRSLRSHGDGALPRKRVGLVTFWDADHGDARSAAEGGALGWMEQLLDAEGMGRNSPDPADGEIWLHCYARVLGHQFKPVSFWYCHRRDGTLRAILVEVNNTFGERHCYLLEQPQFGVEQSARKVFHVSPFCAVEGHYRFRFLFDRLRSRTVARIDYDTPAGPLLQTSVSGQLHALTAQTLRRAFWGYPLHTLVVVARIHWQALQLWLRRTTLWRKPPPPSSFVSRSHPLPP